LTPVGDFHRPPIGPQTPGLTPSQRFVRLGRTLENPFSEYGDLLASNRPFKVGNWLDEILERYGVAVPSGSMLPPGSRVFLEVSCGPGPGAKPRLGLTPPATGSDNSEVASGAWVGQVTVSLEAETPEGLAYTNDVNKLGHDS